MDNPQLTGKKQEIIPHPLSLQKSGTIRLRCASDGHLDQLQERLGLEFSPGARSLIKGAITLARRPPLSRWGHGEHDGGSLSALQNPPGRLIESEMKPP